MQAQTRRRLVSSRRYSATTASKSGSIRTICSPATANCEAFRFIPVLGERADPAKLPPFVQQHQYVDLRDRQRAPEQIRRLVEILRATSSAQVAIPPEYWTTRSPFRSLQNFSPEDSWLFFGRDRDTD